jgi:tetratricopeptide (TPR) repeat protein
VASLPAVECHYTLDRNGAEARLVPSAALATVVSAWEAATDVAKPDLTLLRSGDAEAWEYAAPGIAWLESNPQAWQSFDVIDDLTLAVREAELMGGEELLLAPLFERAWSLLHRVLECNNGRDCALPWALLDNRPALRLVASLFYLRCDQQRWSDAREIARKMVLTLNPNDNHGLRDELAHLCLQDGDAQAALDVCDRYPDDALGPTAFNRALALFMLGRLDEAGHSLCEAMARNPKMLTMLLAAAPRPVRSKGAFVQVGGKEEAWLYRDAYLPVWEKSGALKWAREVARQRKPN